MQPLDRNLEHNPGEYPYLSSHRETIAKIDIFLRSKNFGPFDGALGSGLEGGIAFDNIEKNTSWTPEARIDSIVL